MKRLFLVPFLFLTFQLQAQTLFTYGNHKVSADEFLSAYRKNKTTADSAQNSLQNYLDLYITFKLKVQDAKDHHLDTLPSLEADLQSFRYQIEKNYLYDKKELNFLTEQALKRSKKDIHVTTVFINSVEKLDSLQLLKTASEIAQTLQKNKNANLSAFEKHGLKVTKEDMGFITVFTLPYEIEDMVYELKPGTYSKPFYFDGEYYIFKNEGERPAVGKVKLAQILIAAAPDEQVSWQNAKKIADSLYNALQKGADFAELAKEYSNDRTTYFNGGEMPEISVGKYSPDFEKYAFSLKKDGDISLPFKTTFGYHIIKRISASPVPQNENDDYAYQVKQETLQDPRIEVARNKLLDKARIETGFHNKNLAKSDIYKVTDTSLTANKNITSGSVSSQSTLFTFNDGSKVTMNDWDQFLRNSGKVIGGRLHETYDQLWPDFIDHSILENYQNRLASFDSEYAHQVMEFKEGNMLFEMMQKKVWMNAANDSGGLADYYQQHRGQYKWKQSADAVIFACNSDDAAEQCIKELRTMPWRKVMERNALAVQADSGRFEISQLPLNDAPLKLGPTKPMINKFDGTASFADIMKIYPENMQRDFDDARGLVIEDYQQQLEKQWVNELKKKYPVKVNKHVLESLKQMSLLYHDNTNGNYFLKSKEK